MHRTRGQGSLEYLAVVGLVALVMGALVAPALAGQDVAGGVLAQMRRALCLVSRGDCEQDRRPCVLDANGVRESWHVNVGVVRYGREQLVLRETRSDGTVAVTVLKDRRLGLEAGIGADLRAGATTFGASVRAALLARLGSGTMTVFPSARAADRGMALLAAGGRPPGIVRERIERGGLGSELDAVGGQRTLRVGDELVLGRSVDEATGRTTYALHGTLELAAALGLRRIGGVADAAGDLALMLQRDRGGRFVDLGIAATGELYGSASLPSQLAAVEGMIPTGASAGRRWSLEQHLDLTQPGNAPAAAAFVHALSHPRELPAAARALAARLAHDAVTDFRAYRFVADDDGIGAHLGAGGRLGGGEDRHAERAHLLTALQRGPEGIWRRRSDCLEAVRA